MVIGTWREERTFVQRLNLKASSASLESSPHLTPQSATILLTMWPLWCTAILKYIEVRDSSGFDHRSLAWPLSHSESSYTKVQHISAPLVHLLHRGPWYQGHNLIRTHPSLNSIPFFRVSVRDECAPLEGSSLLQGLWGRRGMPLTPTPLCRRRHKPRRQPPSFGPRPTKLHFGLQPFYPPPGGHTSTTPNWPA